MRTPTCFIFLLLIAALVIPYCANAQEADLPLTIAATGKLLIDIKVNGAPVTCIVDTGSPAFLLLDEQVANSQHLDKKPFPTAIRFFAEDRGGVTYRVNLSGVDIGPWHYENVPALTIDDVKRATGTGYMNLPNFWAQGIVGMGFLEHFHVTVDYPHSTFHLNHDGTALVPRLWSRIMPTIPVGESGKEIPFLLDTGSTFSIASEKMMTPLGLHFLSMGGHGGDALYQGTAKGDHLEIGPYAYPDATFEIADNFETFAGKSAFFGIIGYDFLKDWKVDFDFPHQTLTIQKP